LHSPTPLPSVQPAFTTYCPKQMVCRPAGSTCCALASRCNRWLANASSVSVVFRLLLAPGGPYPYENLTLPDHCAATLAALRNMWENVDHSQEKVPWRPTSLGDAKSNTPRSHCLGRAALGAADSGHELLAVTKRAPMIMICQVVLSPVRPNGLST